MSRPSPRFLSRLIAVAFATCAVLAAIPALATAAITVNTTADNAPNPGECAGAPGDCSLRQAIDKANDAGGPETIVLPAGTYPLTIKGGAENENETGDLDVTGEVTIQGAGARSTTVDATGLEDRVFEVRPAASLSLSRLTVSGGLVTDEYGGGILAENATLALDQVAVRGNTSANSGRGGGLALESSKVTIAASLIADNRNSGDGGGLWTEDGEISIVNTTIANNVVDTSLYPSVPGWGAYGGAMEVNEGDWVLQNVTIAGNSIADKNGGNEGEGAAINGGFGTAQVVNTVIYGNTFFNIDPAEQSFCTETLLSEGHNLEEQPLPEQPRCFESLTDLIANPLLGPLANNGGETDTMALLNGSPAINAGDANRCPATDQRGFPRPQLGGCDIGAYEVQPVPPPPPPVLKPTIKRGKVKVKKAGKTFRVWPGFLVSCPAGTELCTGTVKARAPKIKSKGTATASAKKKVLVGKAKFKVAPGKTKVLKLKLNSRGAKMLRELGKLRTQFEVVARVGNGPPVKAKRTAKLKLPGGR